MAKSGVTTLKGTVAFSGPSAGTAPTVNVLPTVTGVQTRAMTVENAFVSFTDPKGERLLSDDQIRLLTQIKLANSDYFFSISTEDNRSYLFSLVGDLNKYGFESIYNDLIGGRDGKGDLFTKREEYYYKVSLSMREARHKALIDSEIYRDKVEVSEGAFKCGKCGSKETIAVERQMRSADEPMTVTIVCVHCDNTWRA